MLAERKRQRQRAYYANMSADRKIVLAAKQRERRQRKRASNVTEANEEQTPKIIKRTQISEEKELDETAEEPLTLPNVIEPNNTPSIDQFCCPNHLSSTDSGTIGHRISRSSFRTCNNNVLLILVVYKLCYACEFILISIIKHLLLEIDS